LISISSVLPSAFCCALIDVMAFINVLGCLLSWKAILSPVWLNHMRCWNFIVWYELFKFCVTHCNISFFLDKSPLRNIMLKHFSAHVRAIMRPNLVNGA
jgi:hypothetical protein